MKGINIIKCIVFVSIFICIFFIINDIFLRGSKSYELARLNAQYKLTKNSVDVALFGNSTIQSGILHLEMYHNTKIKALQMATSAERIPTTYYKIKELYKNQNPKVLVVDLFLSGDWHDYTEVLHNSLDIMRFNSNKVMAVNSTIEILDKKLECTFPVFAYHSNWKDISFDNMKLRYNTLMMENATSPLCYKMDLGEDYKPKYDISEFVDEVNSMEIDEVRKIHNEITSKYVEKIVELAKEHNSKVVFTCTPKVDIGWPNRYFEIARRLLEDNEDVFFLNIDSQKEQIGIDINSDFNDANHLNYLGARKLTKFLTEYLQENFDIAVNDIDKEIWDEAYNEYCSFLKNDLFMRYENYMGSFDEVFREYY